MGWKIDRDYTNKDEPEYSEVGRMSADPTIEGDTFRFRLRDDDGEVYFGGIFDKSAAEDDSDPNGLYYLLMWADRAYGATDLQVKGPEGHQIGLVHSTRKDRDWVSVYN